MGVPGGAVEQIFGPHLTVALLIQRLVRCIVHPIPACADRRRIPLYGVPRFPPAPTAGTSAQFSPSAAHLTVSTCLRAAIGKVPPRCRTHHTSALLSSPPLGHPTGEI